MSHPTLPAKRPQFIRRWAKRFGRNQAGSTAIEYALLAALAAIAAITGMQAFGDSAHAMYERIGDAISEVMS